MSPPSVAPAVRGQPIRGLHQRTRRVRVLFRLTGRFDPFPLAPESSEFAFKPNGLALALVVGHHSKESYYVGAEGIHLASLHGTGRLRRLTRHFDPTAPFGSDRQADWAPDGRRLVFSRVYSEEGRPAAGRCLSAFTCIRIYHRGRTRALMPDGFHPSWSVRNLIAFQQADAIWVIRPDGRGLRRLVSGGYPDWAPDGRRLVFERERPGTGTAIATIGSDGRRLRLLARGMRPAFSPSGKWIASVQSDDPFRRLCVVTASGRRKHCFRGPDGLFHIDWQPLPRRRP